MKLGFLANAAEAERQMAATLAMTQRAILAGVTDATNSAKQGVRDMTGAAFRGNKLANTWQSKIYGKTSFNPAGLIYSKAPELMRAFSEEVVIHAKGHRFLAVKTENCPKRGSDGRALRFPDGKNDQGNWPVGRYGPLRFVPASQRHAGLGLLVVDNIRVGKNGAGHARAAAGSIAKGKVATVVMAFLIPQVTLKKRIYQEAIIKAACDVIPPDISSH